MQWPMILDISILICEQEQVPLIATATEIDSIRRPIVDALFDSEWGPLWTHDITEANFSASSLKAL